MCCVRWIGSGPLSDHGHLTSILRPIFVRIPLLLTILYLNTTVCPHAAWIAEMLSCSFQFFFPLLLLTMAAPVPDKRQEGSDMSPRLVCWIVLAIVPVVFLCLGPAIICSRDLYA